MKKLPTINPALFSQRGAGYSSAVIPIDTGIKIPNGKHAQRDELSSDECVKMFGAKDAVLMNFKHILHRSRTAIKQVGSRTPNFY